MDAEMNNMGFDPVDEDNKVNNDSETVETQEAVDIQETAKAQEPVSFDTETDYSEPYIAENAAYNPIPEDKPAKSRKKNKKAPKEKAPREKKPVNFFVKLLACLLCGIVFGGAAAGSFYAVDRFVIGPKEAVTEVEENEPITVVPDNEMDKLKDSIRELQSALLEKNTGIQTTNTAVVTDVTTVVEKVMPAMVSITNRGEITSQDWFGRVYTQETESYGSGIIIGESDNEYLIATNNHVIENNKSLSVCFADGSSSEAKVKGYDASIDISVIAVPKETVKKETRKAITVAELGDSDSLKIGEPAIAIGNALGYGQSVTTGVVSAVGREINIDGTTFKNLIQTSAAINPGNSGGALLNIYGQVVGINSSKVGSDTIDNMGFAIPINGIKEILKEFSDREIRDKVNADEKGYLGIGGNDTYDLTALGYPAGVYVAKVYEGSPAEAAGLYMGDVITKVEGQSVKTISELSAFLDYYKAGETVKLTVTRNVSGELEEMILDVVLGTKDAIEE